MTFDLKVITIETKPRAGYFIPVSYTHLLMKLPRPFKGLRSPPLEIAGKKKINVS